MACNMTEFEFTPDDRCTCIVLMMLVRYSVQVEVHASRMHSTPAETFC